MARIMTIVFACFSLGFTQVDKTCLSFFFYDLPLDKSAFVIRDKMLKDTNFILTYNEKSLLHVKRVLAKIERINTCTKSADSANIQLSRSWFYHGNTSKRSTYLKELCVTLYFKTSDLKNAEFESIEKVLAKSYKLKYLTNSAIYSDGPHVKDTIPQTGKIFLLSSEKNYPEIELTKDNSDKNYFYIKLIYTDLY